MITKQLFGIAVLMGVAGAVTAVEIWQGDNRFTLDMAIAYNVKLSSRNLQAPPPDPGPATGGLTDRFYDNGFVRLDVSDNAGGLTSYWGFDSAAGATCDHQPGGSVTLSSTRSPAQGRSLAADEEPQPGIELGYARRLLRWGDERKPWLIAGLEVSGFLMALDVMDTARMTGTATTRDTYHLAPGHVVLSGSYEGSFLGDPPGPLLGSEPVSRDLTSGTVALSHQLQGEMCGFNIGPTFELPLGRSLLLGVSGGWAMVGVRADHRYEESLTVGAEPAVTSSGTVGFDSWNGGPYLKGSLSLNFGERTQIQCGVRWQDTGSLTGRAGGYETSLDLSDAIHVTFGLGYSF